MRSTRNGIWVLRILFCLMGMAVTPLGAASWESKHAEKPVDRLTVLERRVDKLDSKLREGFWYGMLMMLFGSVAALWAQNTGRNPKLWFALGAMFHVFAILLVLVKNGRDIEAKKPINKYTPIFTSADEKESGSPSKE